MRLNVVFEGVEGLAIDIRTSAADAGSSLVEHGISGPADGRKASLLVEDDGALGTPAFLVVVDPNGQPVLKHSVVIGENQHGT